MEGNFTIVLTNEVEDLDGDGVEDHFDLDDDGDGFTDEEEIAYPSDPRDSNSTPNTAPHDLKTTAILTIAENRPVGTRVGEFTATDTDGDILTYALVNGVGSTDNAWFTLETNGTLRTATVFDYETNASIYSIRVQAKDEYNASVEGKLHDHID